MLVNVADGWAARNFKAQIAGRKNEVDRAYLAIRARTQARDFEVSSISAMATFHGNYQAGPFRSVELIG